MIISSKDNKIFNYTYKLLQKKYRDKEQKYIAEGIKIYNDYIDVMDIEYVILSEKANIDKKEGIKYYTFSESLFSKLSTQQNSQGVITIFRYEQNNNIEQDNIVVLDNIQDPGNLGTIIRTLSALGFRELITTSDSVDFFSPKVIRSSMGAIFNMQLKRFDKQAIIELLNNMCYNVFVTNLSNKSITPDKVTLLKRNAFIFGNEGKGVSKEFLDIANHNVLIPIKSNVDSLNLAVSVAILMYEVQKKGGLILN